MEQNYSYAFQKLPFSQLLDTLIKFFQGVQREIIQLIKMSNLDNHIFNFLIA